MKKIDIACIIDDDPIYVYGAKRALELGEICHSILIYHDGKEAFDKLSQIIKSNQKLPDLILLDINMPVWDGWQFLDEFVKIPIKQKITIFMVSSSIDPSDTERAKTYEAVSDFIIKPITIDKLRNMLMHVSNN
ncbi:MAG TPA: response regulator [Bacteroidia bacterium]